MTTFEKGGWSENFKKKDRWKVFLILEFADTPLIKRHNLILFNQPELWADPSASSPVNGMHWKVSLWDSESWIRNGDMPSSWLCLGMLNAGTQKLRPQKRAICRCSGQQLYVRAQPTAGIPAPASL